MNKIMCFVGYTHLNLKRELALGEMKYFHFRKHIVFCLCYNCQVCQILKESVSNLKGKDVPQGVISIFKKELQHVLKKTYENMCLRRHKKM